MYIIIDILNKFRIRAEWIMKFNFPVINAQHQNFKEILNELKLLCLNYSFLHLYIPLLRTLS